MALLHISHSPWPRRGAGRSGWGIVERLPTNRSAMIPCAGALCPSPSLSFKYFVILLSVSSVLFKTLSIYSKGLEVLHVHSILTPQETRLDAIQFHASLQSISAVHQRRATSIIFIHDLLTKFVGNKIHSFCQLIRYQRPHSLYSHTYDSLKSFFEGYIYTPRWVTSLGFLWACPSLLWLSQPLSTSATWLPSLVSFKLFSE